MNRYVYGTVRISPEGARMAEAMIAHAGDPYDDDEPDEPLTDEEYAMQEADERREALHDRGYDADYPDGIDEWSAH